MWCSCDIWYRLCSVWRLSSYFSLQPPFFAWRGRLPVFLSAVCGRHFAPPSLNCIEFCAAFLFLSLTVPLSSLHWTHEGPHHPTRSICFLELGNNFSSGPFPGWILCSRMVYDHCLLCSQGNQLVMSECGLHDAQISYVSVDEKFQKSADSPSTLKSDMIYRVRWNWNSGAESYSTFWTCMWRRTDLFMASVKWYLIRLPGKN